MVGSTLALFLVGQSSAAHAEPSESVRFVEISSPGISLAYERVPSTTNEAWTRFKEQTVVPPWDAEAVVPYTFPLIVASPEKARGSPGVAILDYDRDGDEDVFVTNGPGAPNSLFRSLLSETGHLTFEDVGSRAGVGLDDRDSTGVCYADTDNDGDEDLYVLHRGAEATFLENLGDGTFRDATEVSGLGAGAEFNHTSCSFGDIDHDGFVDVVIGNTFDWKSREAIFVEPVAFNHPNQLFRNNGDGSFTDVSASSGIQDITGFAPAILDGAGTISWGVAMIDIDEDGDMDIVHADDNAALPFFADGGVDRGFVHVLKNDGRGKFSDTAQLGPGDWMGVSFGDFDCNGRIDIMATNIGDYMFQVLPFPNVLGKYASRWFLQEPDGSFSDPGVGEDIVATPFGWSTSTWDYDNDGDTDIVYFGSLGAAAHTATMDNPGALLRNEGCSGRFTRDDRAFAASTSHGTRAIHGAAIGDLNADGF